MLKGFKCKRCGECCRTPKLNKTDIKRIKRVGYKEEDFVENFPIGNYIKEKKGWCMFLKRGKRAFCKIYKARPETCRLYPSELINGSCKPEKLASDKLFEKRENLKINFL